MEAFSALLALREENPPVTGEFPPQRPVTRSFDVFFDLAPEQTIEQTTETAVIWDATALIITSLQCLKKIRRVMTEPNCVIIRSMIVSALYPPLPWLTGTVTGSIDESCTESKRQELTDDFVKVMNDMNNLLGLCTGDCIKADDIHIECGPVASSGRRRRQATQAVNITFSYAVEK